MTDLTLLSGGGITPEAQVAQMVRDLPDDWRTAWATVGALWPHDVPAGAATTLLTWYGVVSTLSDPLWVEAADGLDDVGLEEHFTGREFGEAMVSLRRGQDVAAKQIPEITRVIRELYDGRARRRATRPALPAPNLDPEEAVRKGISDAFRLLKAQLLVDSRRGTNSDAELERAYADAAARWTAMFPHHADLFGEEAPEPTPQGGQDRALAHEDADVEAGAGPSDFEKRAEQIATEFIADPSSWPPEKRAELSLELKAAAAAAIARKRKEGA